MNKKQQRRVLGVMLTASCLMSMVQGAVTNTVPWGDSFELYPSGMNIDGTNGWSGQSSDEAWVTNDAVRMSMLISYTNTSPAVRGYPLPSATHSNIMQVNSMVANAIQSLTGGVVYVDFMAIPTWNADAPLGQGNDQCAFYIGTNGLLTIWHQNRVPSPATNEWLTLTNSTMIGTNEWTRFTVVQDYSNQMFQIRVNETNLVDGKGWGYGGATQGGAWFYMVQTNGVLSTLVAEGSPAFLDDVVAANRTLVWSRNGFAESVTNNGEIDNSSPLNISLTKDVFNGTQGEDFVRSGKMMVVSGLPSNLSAVATWANSTNISVILTNRALFHESSDSVSNLVLSFTDSAFAFGRSWDVAGYKQTNLVVSFTNTPALGYSRLSFYESSANDGSIDNTSPLRITLTNGTFAGVGGEDFATNSLKLQILHLPSGLTGQVLLVTANQLEVRIIGNAIQHNVAQNISDLELQFLGAAFNIGAVPLSSVFNLNTNMNLVFIDPSVLNCTTTNFMENAANDGSVSGTTLTLVNKAFNATQGEDMVANNKVLYSHLPVGLGLQIIRGDTAQSATLIFTGTATSNAAINSTSNLTITLTDNAVVGGNAAGVTNYSLVNLIIQFKDPRALTYSSVIFYETALGMIDNRFPITIKLIGDTLSGTNGEDFVASGKISLTHLPPDLVAQITRDSVTGLSVRLLGAAISNASSDSVGDVTITFTDGAFTGLDAIHVTNYVRSDIRVVFTDLAENFNFVPFEDPFETYAVGLPITGTNGWYADYLTDAAIVTNDAAIIAKFAGYAGGSFPIMTNHAQVLFVQNNLHNNIHSGSSTNVVVDFLAIPVPNAEEPASDVNDQMAFYVTTNKQLVIWQRDVASLSNGWITLSNAPAISTSTWVRLTVENDYVHNLFQIRVNEGGPIQDPRGWTLAGAAPTGTWFHMAQTNGYMTTFRMTGQGAGYLDDFTVRESLPNYFGIFGTVYTIR